MNRLNGSFEYPKHMLKLMGKKIFTILRLKKCLSKPVSSVLFLWYCLLVSYLKSFNSFISYIESEKCMGLVMRKPDFVAFEQNLADLYYSLSGNYNSYGKCSKISNTSFSFLNKMLIIRTIIHKMLVRLTNREDPDQTASSEAV